MSKATKKSVIIIAGPTAVGKTRVAIAVASHFHTGIISADSRQCYKELNIGVARPSEEELKLVPHFFVASHTIKEEITAAGFEAYALEKLNELFQLHDVVVMTGGTGLYIKAFCEGFDKIPEADPLLRKKIVDTYYQNGLNWLQEQVRIKDPEFYAVGEIQNPHRLMRALEIIEGTGKSIVTYRKGQKAQRNFNIIKIGLELPKEALHKNIHLRVDAMIQKGLLEEARSLLANRHLRALQTVGYAELFDYYDGKLTLEESIERIKINTRQYAKRQLTWFRKDKDMKWFLPSEISSIIAYIESVL